MKGYRFYAEMPEARKSKSASKATPFFPWTVGALRAESNVNGFKACIVAVDLCNGNPVWNSDGTMCATTSAFDSNHYSYCGGSVSREYLRKRCVRVPEELARKLSPEIFRYLSE